MKLNASVRSSRMAGGMTLVELMVALGIVGFVFLVCYSSSTALQRGFGYTTAWTEARNNQARLLDSLAVDLRNCTDGTVAVSLDETTKLPLTLLPFTLTIPKRYSDYEPEEVNTPSGLQKIASAGDPKRTANPTSLPTPDEFGKITYTDTITVIYDYPLLPDGSKDRTRITRKVVWPGWPSGLASRDVATFPNGSFEAISSTGQTPVTLILYSATNPPQKILPPYPLQKILPPYPPTTYRLTKAVSMITTKIQTRPDPAYLNPGPGNTSTLEDTVFLRQLSIQPTPTPTPTPSP